MGRKKKIVEETIEEVVEDTTNKEKEELLALYQKLKDMKIDRISDLENLISRL